MALRNTAAVEAAGVNVINPKRGSIRAGVVAEEEHEDAVPGYGTWGDSSQYFRELRQLQSLLMRCVTCLKNSLVVLFRTR